MSVDCRFAIFLVVLTIFLRPPTYALLFIAIQAAEDDAEDDAAVLSVAGFYSISLFIAGSLAGCALGHCLPVPAYSLRCRLHHNMSRGF